MFNKRCTEYLVLRDLVNGRTDLPAPIVSEHETDRRGRSDWQIEQIIRSSMYCAHVLALHDPALGGFGRLMPFMSRIKSMQGEGERGLWRTQQIGMPPEDVNVHDMQSFRVTLAEDLDVHR